MCYATCRYFGLYTYNSWIHIYIPSSRTTKKKQQTHTHTMDDKANSVNERTNKWTKEWNWRASIDFLILIAFFHVIRFCVYERVLDRFLWKTSRERKKSIYVNKKKTAVTSSSHPQNSRKTNRKAKWPTKDHWHGMCMPLPPCSILILCIVHAIERATQE